MFDQNPRCKFPIRSGVDLEEVDRIKGLINRWGDRFLRRVFTDQELQYCLGKATTPMHLAGRFAAKEAVIKTLKDKVSPPLKTIEILRGENGRPQVRLHREAKTLAGEMRIDKIDITISHTKNFAVAFALAYFKE